MADPRPNIVIIQWHDAGRLLGTYGAAVDTPVVDRLAADGVRFDRAFAAAPLCSPARAALYTGRYPHTVGMLGHAELGWCYPPAVDALPEQLGRAGYRTVLAGPQPRRGDPPGFSEIVGEDVTDAAALTDAVLGWLDGHSGGLWPFLLVVGFTEAHRPWPADRHPPGTRPPADAVPGYLPDNDWTRTDVALLQSVLRDADRETGRLLDRLDALGLADGTWVIFTTDRGPSLPGAEGTLRDPGIAVALISRAPRAWPTTEHVTDRLASHVDVLPTVLDGLGLEQPPGMHGVSHASWLAGDRAAPRRREIFAETTFGEAYDPVRAVRTKRWKYIRSYEPRPRLVLSTAIERSAARRGYGDDHLRPRPMEELYDLASDPGERRNLADDPVCAAIRVDLAGRLVRWRQRTADPLLAGAVRPAPCPPDLDPASFQP